MKYLITITLFILFSTLSFSQIDKIIESFNGAKYLESYKMIEYDLKNNISTGAHFYYKALMENKENNFIKAIESIYKGLSLIDKKDTLYLPMMYFLSVNLELNLQYKEAIDNLNLVLFDNPNNIDALNNISYIYIQEYRYNDSFKALHKAYDLDTTNTLTLQNLAYLCSQVNDLISTKKYAEMALKYPLKPLSKSSVLNSLGLAQSQLISKELGIATVEEGIKVSPNNMYSYLTLGLIHWYSQDYDSACKNFKKCKELGGVRLTSNLLKYCEE